MTKTRSQIGLFAHAHPFGRMIRTTSYVGAPFIRVRFRFSSALSSIAAKQKPMPRWIFQAKPALPSGQKAEQRLVVCSMYLPSTVWRIALYMCVSSAVN